MGKKILCFAVISLFYVNVFALTGDVNGDNLITSQDASITMQHILNNDFEINKTLADVDNNGVITSLDASAILQKVLNGDYENDLSIYNLTGFAKRGNVTGGSEIEQDSQYYKKVYTAYDLAEAFLPNSDYRVVEIMNDLELGYNLIEDEAKGFINNRESVLTYNYDAEVFDELKKSGISLLEIKKKENMTIFSENGAKLLHCGIEMSNCNNIIFRNLELEGLWEWDESGLGAYDYNDWDYITVSNSHNIWIDHCTFHKAYDGVVDLKNSSSNVTISWCNFPYDNDKNSSVARQIYQLEENMELYPTYKHLRQVCGFTVDEIIDVCAGNKKTHLVGSNDFDMFNKDLSLTLCYNYYENSQERMPRLRAGNVHIFNIFINSQNNYELKNNLKDKFSKVSGYKFSIGSDGFTSTEDGAVLAENCYLKGVLKPLVNNKKDSSLSEYTGKIMAKNTILHNNSIFKGNSTDENSPLAPVPAPAKDFSFNGFDKVDYAYTLYPPEQVPDLVQNAGAGKVQLNWLKTSY